MRVTVASGKGGTGKTLIATSLARVLSQRLGQVYYIDADVEEPNGHLFLAPGGAEKTRTVGANVPVLTTEACSGSGCAKCQQICVFNAILAVSDGVVVLDQLCHECGACLLACPDKALGEKERAVGAVCSALAGPLEVRWGLLNVGEPRAEPVLQAVLEELPSSAVGIIDAAPGTGCVAVGAIQPADAVVLVTEPTPMGLHDVRSALAVTRALGKDPLVIINRSDLGDHAVERFLRSAGVSVVAKIPFEEGIAKSYAVGDPPLDASACLRDAVESLARALERRMEGEK